MRSTTKKGPRTARLRTAERSTVLAAAGAWSVCAFLPASSVLALCMNVLVLVLLLIAIGIAFARLTHA